MTAGSGEGKDTSKDKWGVVLGHAYTVAGTVELPDGAKLIKARNPWGSDSYIGRYGADDPRWERGTNLAKVPEAQNDEDGYIFMPVDQFKRSFSSIAVNYRSDKMKMDYYLKIGDTPGTALTDSASDDLKYVSKKCGPDCILAEVVVVSTEAQRVWVSLNTWSSETMPETCWKNNSAESKSYITPTPHG